MRKIDIEETILAEGITSKAIAREACDYLTPEDFGHDRQNKLIFSALREVLESDGGLNRANLAVEFEKRAIDTSRATQLMAKHAQTTPTEEEIKFLIGHLKQINERERIIESARSLVGRAEDQTVPMNDIRRTIDVMSDIITPSKLRQGNQVSVVGDRFRSNIDTPANTILTGILSVDRETNGLPKKEVTVICGNSGSGKTSLALAIAYNVARSGKEVAYYCFEMAEEKMYEKILSHHGRIPYFVLEKRPPHELRRWKDSILKASMELDELPLHMFDESTTPDLDRLEESIRYRVRKNNVELVIIDYLQLVPVIGKDEEYARVTEVSSRLRRLAKALDICIIALTQPNNQFDRRIAKDGGLPKLIDMHGSGQIGKDAAIVFFIMRRKYGTEFIQAGMKHKFYLPFHETRLYYLKGRYGNAPSMFGDLAFIPNYSMYVNAFWDDEKYQPMTCPQCGSPHIKYKKGRIFCPGCRTDEKFIDKEAKSGLIFKQQKANIFGKDFIYDFAFLSKGNYQSDTIIKEIKNMNGMITSTEDGEPIRRIKLHDDSELAPVIIGQYVEEEEYEF